MTKQSARADYAWHANAAHANFMYVVMETQISKN